MAAFTEVSQTQLENYLFLYDRGELVNFEATAHGIENSNFFLTLNKEDQLSEFVLTIFETLSFAEVPFFNQLATHLHQYGLAVAPPQRTLDGMSYTIFRSKPAVLFERLPGDHLMSVKTSHCEQIGQALAELHQATATFKQQRPNPYDESWLIAAIEKLPEDSRVDITSVATEYSTFQEDASALPQSIIHGDLFVDNTLFLDDKLSALLDWYHACNDACILDLAITINDWAFRNGDFQPDLANSVITAYRDVRELTTEEMKIWPAACRAAAFRFWLTRLETSNGNTYLKDPEEFRRIFSWHENTLPLN